MGEFSSLGYVRARLDEWLTDLQDIWTGVFGASYDYSSDTQDGQLIAALAEAFSNEDQKAESVSKAFNPLEAEGNSLSALVRINGITRIDSSSSVVTLSMTGTNGTVIPAGSVVRSSDTDEQFSTDASATISGGTTSVQASSVTSGEIEAQANTITIIDSNIAGWSTVTNDNDATVGIDEESDQDLRVRRRNSVAVSSEGNVDSVRGALLGVDDVINAVVVENDTGSVSSDGMPANSIAPIVEGGTAADIAAAVFAKKSAGCLTFGSLTETATDSQGFGHDINYSRPDDKNIYIEMTVKNLGDLSSSASDEIKASIIDYFVDDADTRLSMGDDVLYSAMYIPIMSIANLSVTALTVDTVTPAVGTSDIDITFGEIARFDETRITVTVN